MCIGLTAHEVHCALQLRGIEPASWPDIAPGVLLMGQTAAETINKKKR